MGRLSEDQKVQLRGVFADYLTDPVGLLLFTRNDGRRAEGPVEPICESCSEVESLLSEMSECSPNISLEIFDFDEDRDAAERYGVSEVPAVVVLGNEDYGIRFYGMPIGYEFAPFVQAILNVSSGETQLGGEALKSLTELENPVEIKLFVTPT